MKPAIAFSAALALALPSIATAQSWKPSRHVELVAPSAAGGGSDTIARLVQRVLQENKIVEVPVNVVNKAGAGGTLAWSGLNQHPGDGHYISISTVNLLTNFIAGRSPLSYAELTPLAQLFSDTRASPCAPIRRSRAAGS